MGVVHSCPLPCQHSSGWISSATSSPSSCSSCSPSAWPTAPSTGRGRSSGPEVEDLGFWQMGTESQVGLEGLLGLMGLLGVLGLLGQVGLVVLVSLIGWVGLEGLL